MKNRHILLLACVVMWSLCKSPSVPYTPAMDAQEQPVLVASLLPEVPEALSSGAGLYVPPARMGMQVASPVLGSAGGGGGQPLSPADDNPSEESEATAVPRPTEEPVEELIQEPVQEPTEEPTKESVPEEVELRMPAFVAEGTDVFTGRLIGDAELVALVDGAQVPCLVSTEGEFTVLNTAGLPAGTEIVMMATDANGGVMRAISMVAKKGAAVLEQETEAEKEALEVITWWGMKQAEERKEPYDRLRRAVTLFESMIELLPADIGVFAASDERLPEASTAPEPTDKPVPIVTPAPTDTPEPTVTPEPADLTEPTMMPTATPQPTPGVAEEVSRQIAEDARLTVDPPPARVDQPTVRLTGAADPGAVVRLLLGEKVLDKATAARNGTFTLDGKLPEGGEHILTVEATPKGGSPSTVSYSVCYELPALTLTVLAPVEPIKRREETVRGITLPNAKIDIRGEGLVGSVRANAKGEFSFRVKIAEEGDVTYTLTAMLKGYEPVQTEFTVTRILNEQEALNAFRRSRVYMDYNTLLLDPTKYEGKHASYRGRIAEIGDMDGAPCLLVQSRYQGGKWKEPIWVVCDELPPYPVDTVFTAYVEYTGQSAAYTDGDGNKQQLPVMRLRFHAK